MKGRSRSRCITIESTRAYSWSNLFPEGGSCYSAHSVLLIWSSAIIKPMLPSVTGHIYPSVCRYQISKRWHLICLALMCNSAKIVLFVYCCLFVRWRPRIWSHFKNKGIQVFGFTDGWRQTKIWVTSMGLKSLTHSASSDQKYECVLCYVNLSVYASCSDNGSVMANTSAFNLQDLYFVFPLSYLSCFCSVFARGNGNVYVG